MSDIESGMVLIRTKKIGKEFGLDPRAVSKILRSIGAKKWRSSTSSGGGSIYYWDKEHDSEMRMKLLEILNKKVGNSGP